MAETSCHTQFSPQARLLWTRIASHSSTAPWRAVQTYHLPWSGQSCLWFQPQSFNWWQWIMCCFSLLHLRLAWGWLNIVLNMIKWKYMYTTTGPGPYLYVGRYLWISPRCPIIIEVQAFFVFILNDHFDSSANCKALFYRRLFRRDCIVLKFECGIWWYCWWTAPVDW